MTASMKNIVFDSHAILKLTQRAKTGYEFSRPMGSARVDPQHEFQAESPFINASAFFPSTSWL